MDEFKVLKAQMDQRYGGKKPQNTKRTRKVSDRTMEDYNKLVEADTSEDESPTYESEYRGKVQNRRTELTPEPALVLTYYTGQSDFQRKMYNKELERLNRLGVLPARLVLTHDEVSLDEARIQKHFSSIQALSDKIARQPDNTLLYLARSIDEYLVQDFEKALADADRAIELDSSYLLAYYMRVQIRMKNQEVRMAEKSEVPSAGEVKWTFDASHSEYQAALDDCDRILAREPDFAGCYYNKGNIYMQLKLWPEAIKAYTQAIKLHADMSYELLSYKGVRL